MHYSIVLTHPASVFPDTFLRKGTIMQDQDWHRKIVHAVKTNTQCGHEQAMIILAVVCEYAMDAYKQGYERGHLDGTTEERAKHKSVQGK